MNNCNDIVRKEDFIKNVLSSTEYKEYSEEIYALRQYVTISSCYVLSEMEKKLGTNEFNSFMNSIFKVTFVNGDIAKVRIAVAQELNITVNK